MTSCHVSSSVSDKKPRKSDQTREQILSAAALLFREKGYNAATLRKIAQAAGMEAGSIYYHFGSKDEILDDVLEIGLGAIVDAVSTVRAQALADGTNFRKTFAQLVHTHLIYLLDASDFTSANIRNFPMLPPHMRERHRPLRQAYAELWESFLTEARAAGKIRADIRITPLRQFVLGALNWTVEWYDPKRYPVHSLADRVSKLLLDGMVTTPESSTSPLPPVLGITKTASNGARLSKVALARAQILSASARTFRDKGYSAATLRDIAAEAGMEAGSIYYHFKSKVSILDEVLDLGLRDMLEGVSATLADEARYPTYRSRIEAGIHAHMMYLFALSEFSSANIRIYGQLPKDVRMRHQPVRRELARIWDGCFGEAQEAGVIYPYLKVVPLRQMVLGSLNWTVEWFNPDLGDRDGYYTLAEMIHMLQTLLLDGIVREKVLPQKKGVQG